MNRIEKAIDIFLDALNNKTLDAANCAQCAVGNLFRSWMLEKNQIVKSKYEIDIYKDLLVDTSIVEDEEGFDNRDWRYAFCTYRGKQTRSMDSGASGFIKKYSDYTEDELAQIEFTFETTYGKKDPDEPFDKDKAIRALTAVVKLMESFEEPSPVQYAEEFQSKAELVLA